MAYYCCVYQSYLFLSSERETAACKHRFGAQCWLASYTNVWREKNCVQYNEKSKLKFCMYSSKRRQQNHNLNVCGIQAIFFQKTGLIVLWLSCGHIRCYCRDVVRELICVAKRYTCTMFPSSLACTYRFSGICDESFDFLGTSWRHDLFYVCLCRDPIWTA